MPTHMEIVLQAAAFAAEKHRNGRRKDAEASPYINHPIQLAYILVQADIEIRSCSPPRCCTTRSKTPTPRTTKSKSCSDTRLKTSWSSAPTTSCSTKLERKQAQVDKAAKISQKAKLVKIADKIANVSDIDGAPPAGWSVERKREYYDWAKRSGPDARREPRLEARFDAEYASVHDGHQSGSCFLPMSAVLVRNSCPAPS